MWPLFLLLWSPVAIRFLYKNAGDRQSLEFYLWGLIGKLAIENTFGEYVTAWCSAKICFYYITQVSVTNHMYSVILIHSNFEIYR